MARPVVRRLRRLAAGAAAAVGLESRNRRREVQRRLAKTRTERDIARARVAKGAEAQEQLKHRADELAT